MIQLVDDGTLDTVLQCDICNRQMRYSFDPEWVEYHIFVTWVIADAIDGHVCDEFAEVN